jgi:hypothetical protein
MTGESLDYKGPAPTSAAASGRDEAQALLERLVIVRGSRVMVDVDLASVYGVPPKRLNEQVRRNRERFPEDFAFQLTLDEARGQNLKHPPQVFTEHGAVMLAAVLNSPIAIDASIQVVRAFVRLRAMVAMHEGLAPKHDALERKFDQQFSVVFEAIRQLMTPPRSSASRIGFRQPEHEATPDDGGDA